VLRRFPAAGLALAVSLVLAACGGGSSPSPTFQSAAASVPASAPASAEASASGGGAAACEQAATDADFVGDVTIKNFAFDPNPVTIKVDEAVQWKNDDSASHTATMDDGSCSTDNIAGGTTAKLVFHVAGTYAYHCRIHSSMTGTVEVTP
jgi:plastocyanin